MTVQAKSTDKALTSAVLSHIARYRLTTPEAIVRMPAFVSVSSRRTRRLLAACQGDELIAHADLHQGRPYWHLDASGANQLGCRDFGPLSEPAKIRAYALLRFCCLMDQPRQRLTRAEITERWPEVPQIGLPGSYYFVATAAAAKTERLGLARIDAGHHGRWDRIVQTVREDVTAHLRRPAWRRLIEANRFELTVITVFPQKAERLRETFACHSVLAQVNVTAIAMPELLPLVFSIRGKEVLCP